MAFFHCHFFSPTLHSNTDVHIFIPTPNSDEVLNSKRSDYFHEGVKYQVLYLLHGAYGDYTDWIRQSSVEKYAHDHKLALVMPSVSNSFYQDMYHGGAYLTYLLEELPRFVRIMFPISGKREDTFTAGLSMGGYGALRLAFQKPDAYAACASLSGAIDLQAVMADVRRGTLNGPFLWDAIFEHPEAVEGTDADLFALIARRKKEGVQLPRVFQSCGTKGFIYKTNVVAREKMEKLGVDLTYEEHPGIHNWDYWDKHIQRVLNWLPLKNGTVIE